MSRATCGVDRAAGGAGRGTRIGRTCVFVLGAGVSLAAWSGVARAQAQNTQVNHAFDLEQAGKWREAIAAWRQVIGGGDIAQGVLGIERVFTQLSMEDSVLPALDTLLARHPADRVLRGAQLRVLRSMGRDTDARNAFHEWTRIAPRDPVPYREYAGQLLNDGRASAADTVLQEASSTLGSTKELVIEVAQLRAALGLWTAAGVAWREALVAEPFLESSAVYSLQAAPLAFRDSVRAALVAPPAAARAASPAGGGVPPTVRKVLGSLELQWGAARDGWRAISALTTGDSAYTTWSDFADDAERIGAWLAARDALAAMNKERPSPAIAVRAANAALSGGEPGSAIALLAFARTRLQPFQVRLQVLPLEVRALSQLGRAADAEKLVGESAEFLDPHTKQGYARQIAWGWIRAGDVERARAALAGASGDDEDEVTAWIALYDGNLARARTGLRRPADATSEVVTVMAFLGRTHADSSREAGAAFLALARGDSVQAAARFERAAGELSDAAPLLLALAARVQTARRQDRAAIALWQRIVQSYVAAPEAAEADLEWGRMLRRKGDSSGAVERFEHLILTYPQSALVPQARRELDAVRNPASVQ